MTLGSSWRRISRAGCGTCYVLVISRGGDDRYTWSFWLRLARTGSRYNGCVIDHQHSAGFDNVTGTMDQACHQLMILAKTNRVSCKRQICDEQLTVACGMTNRVPREQLIHTPPKHTIVKSVIFWKDIRRQFQRETRGMGWGWGNLLRGQPTTNADDYNLAPDFGRGREPASETSKLRILWGNCATMGHAMIWWMN